jgi:hypothetical protein
MLTPAWQRPGPSISQLLDFILGEKPGSESIISDYATPDVIPGMFKIDDPVNTGRVILAAMNFGGKVVGIGMVYNYRDTSQTNPSTGAAFTADGLYNTGNFILFEREIRRLGCLPGSAPRIKGR